MQKRVKPTSSRLKSDRPARRSLALQLDVTKKSQIDEAVQRAVAEFGHIDILLNCSGVTHESDFLSFTEDAFNQCIDRGPKSYFLAAQAVGRQMAEQRSGKIINLSTTDARIASGESAGNSAAYSSIDAMTRAIAQALGFYGVNANALVYGPMNYCSDSSEEAASGCGAFPWAAWASRKILSARRFSWLPTIRISSRARASTSMRAIRMPR